MEIQVTQDFFKLLVKRAGSKEDVFTECLAEAMRQDPQLAEDFLILICGVAVVDDVQISGSKIAIETQVSFPEDEGGKHSIPDMVFTLNSILKIAVENKLDAPESKSRKKNTSVVPGDGPSKEESLKEPDQLIRYLNRKELDKVAFITSNSREGKILEQVVTHPKYLKPHDRSHFLWDDFFYVVKDSTERLGDFSLSYSLLILFCAMGFDPPVAQIGDLSEETDEGLRRRKNFAKLLALTRSELESRGWNCHTDRKGAELYAKKGQSIYLKQVLVTGLRKRGKLTISIAPFDGEAADEIDHIYPEVEEYYGGNLKAKPFTDNSKARQAEFSIPLGELLDGAWDSVESIQKKMSQFVLHIYSLVESALEEAD